METIIRQFESIAALHGSAPAIVTNIETLSYDDLNRQANRSADIILARCGIENTPVAMLFSHSGWRQIAAVLGGLKARKNIAAINPHPETKKWGTRGYMPSDYIHGFVARLDPDLIICDQSNVALAETVCGGRKIINVDARFWASEANPVGIDVRPTDHSFLLHTTGTSGEIKVVQRTNELDAYVQEIGNNPPTVRGDISTLFRTANTAAMADAFFALLNGAALAIYDLADYDSAHLTDWVLNNRVSVFRAVGTVFRMLDFERGNGFPDVRLVNLGGEPITEIDQRCSEEWFKGARFVARYACSEVGEIAHGPTSAALTAIGDRVVSVEDGEIVVDSAYMAEGYWLNSERTQAKFKDLGDGRRRYYTGDKGFIRDNGRLCHEGRIGVAEGVLRTT